MPTIVVIDDQITTLKLLYKILKNINKFPGLEVATFAEEAKALAWMKQHNTDLILLDYKLPHINGIELITLIRQWPSYKAVPIVMITAYDDTSVRYAALDAGANDFISKPIDYRECQARCTNLLQLRMHQLQLEDHNKKLSDKIDETSLQILEREREALYHLAKAGEYRDSDTGNHILRIARYSKMIAKGIGMDDEFCDLIEHASPMHDVGKIGIPDNILLKPAKLSQQEWLIMRKHCAIGFEILNGSTSKYMQIGATIALHHHERFDGSGYPYGLTGDTIPIEARIVAVADVFDALTCIRPYKAPWSMENAVKLLKDETGKHFDPMCVDAFLGQIDTVEEIYKSFNDADVLSNNHLNKNK